MDDREPTFDDVLDDLVAEHERLERILTELDDAAWAAPSGADGWSVTDVVLHLAQTEESVVATVAAPPDDPSWRSPGESVDDMVARMVADERASAAAVFERWQAARRAAVAALRRADPGRPLLWAAAPLKPKTLATTRLAEHWAHGLDITEPLGIEFADTARLRHIAWLGHSSLPYAARVEGIEPHDVHCELTAPEGSVWRFGPRAATSTITGPAGDFCRVGARRLSPADSRLVATGPHGPTALRVLRNYAA